MNKTVEMEVQDAVKKKLLDIVSLFENMAMSEIKSNEHSYNDCAVITKCYLIAAKEIRDRI